MYRMRIMQLIQKNWGGSSQMEESQGWVLRSPLLVKSRKRVKSFHVKKRLMSCRPSGISNSFLDVAVLVRILGIAPY